MAIQFQDVERAVRIDLDVASSSTVSPQTINRFCVEVYHELIHTKPDLQTVFDPATGNITDLPENLDYNTATEFPDSMDGRWVSILAGVKARVVKQFLTTDAQVARYKIEAGDFLTEQGVTKPR